MIFLDLFSQISYYINRKLIFCKVNGKFALNKKEDFMAFKKILVPVDFSYHSERAIQFSKTLAQDFQAKLIFLHSVEQEAHPAFYAISTTPILKENPELKNRILKNLIKLTEMTENDAQYAITEGKAHKQIELYAKKNSIDLIVMATRGLSKLEQFLIGSNTERVVATAPCPVLTIERDV